MRKDSRITNKLRAKYLGFTLWKNQKIDCLSRNQSNWACACLAPMSQTRSALTSCTGKAGMTGAGLWRPHGAPHPPKGPRRMRPSARAGMAAEPLNCGRGCRSGRPGPLPAAGFLVRDGRCGLSSSHTHREETRCLETSHGHSLGT